MSGHCDLKAVCIISRHPSCCKLPTGILFILVVCGSAIICLVCLGFILGKVVFVSDFITLCIWFTHVSLPWHRGDTQVEGLNAQNNYEAKAM